MFFNAITFLSGVMLLQNFSYLPKLSVAIGIFACIILSKLFAKKYQQYLHLPAVFALGFAWCLCYAHIQTAWILPNELEGKNMTITGYIASMPELEQQRSSWLFSIKNITTDNKKTPAKGLIHLSWQDPKQHLTVGDQWQFTVRLKKIHGTMNPGGFDYEAWSLQKGIRATGYVYHDDAKFISSHWYHYPLDRIREFLYQKMTSALLASETSPWIIALAIGVREGISAESWQVLRNTGTNHLMAIAGLHIGLMSSFIYALINYVWRRIPKLTNLLPAQHAGGLAALMIAVMYAGLAGFSLPTERACIMIVIFFMIALLRRHIVTWHAWNLALFAVLFVNPLSVLTESFWLSFSSVALIIYGVSGRLAPRGLWWKYGRIQWILTIGLVPLSIWFFQECSWVSFIANSIAIPWVGFLIVPLTLFGCLVLMFSTQAGSFLLLMADKLLAILWHILSYLAHVSWATWYHVVPNTVLFMIACVGVILLLLPSGFPGRWLGIICLLPFFLYQPLAPALGEAWVTLLDVGQGLSAVVQTQKHILVFDTGVRSSDNFDMGESVVLPFLHTLNAKKIDMLIVSHRDNDHSGGAKTILQQMKTLQIKSSSPELFPDHDTSYCLRHESWEWDDVKFAFLYPSIGQLNLDNNSSCVLRIATKNHSVLMPGDIEKSAEKFLVKESFNELSSDILIAPHHGSKTSFVNPFIELIHPKIVLFPVGYHNQYHFPNAGVLANYHQMGVDMYDSVNAGAIQFQLTDISNLIPLLYRPLHQRYWNFI